MDCLDGFIGLRAACDELGEVVPKSGLYVEDLHGISCDRAALTDSGKYTSGRELLNNRIKYAGQLVCEEAAQLLANDLRIIRSLETGTIGAPVGGVVDDTIGAATALKKGIRLTRRPNQLHQITIPTVWVKMDTDVADQILYIEDGDTTHQYAVSFRAGREVRVDTNFEAANDEVYVYTESATAGYYTGSTTSTQRYRPCETCPKSIGMEYLLATGELDGVEDSKGYGLRIDVVVACSIARALCMFAPALKFAILYRAGVEILREEVATNRLNLLAINGHEWAVETADRWETVEYPKYFKGALPSLATQLRQMDKACFECGGLRQGYVHP